MADVVDSRKSRKRRFSSSPQAKILVGLVILMISLHMVFSATGSTHYPRTPQMALITKHFRVSSSSRDQQLQNRSAKVADRSCVHGLV